MVWLGRHDGLGPHAEPRGYYDKLRPPSTGMICPVM